MDVCSDAGCFVVYRCGVCFQFLLVFDAPSLLIFLLHCFFSSGISMLAVLGYLLNAGGVHFPGLISYDGTKFADIPFGVAALGAVPSAGIAQIIGFIGLLELAVMKDITGGEFVGDFRNGYIDFGWYVFSCDLEGWASHLTFWLLIPTGTLSVLKPS
jgi:hypothetical protein